MKITVIKLAATGTECSGVIELADNHLAVFLNGDVVKNVKTENNPALTETFNFTLRAGQNFLLLTGANWHGPASFKGKLMIPGNQPIEFDDSFPGEPWTRGLVWGYQLEIRA